MEKINKFIKFIILGTVPNISILAASNDYSMFGAKEEIVYNVHWSFISVGRATLGIQRVSSSTLRVYSAAESYKFFDSFYKVRDSVESLWDTRFERSLKFAKRLREGKKSSDTEIIIDTATDTARLGEDKWKVTRNALDVLSALHYVRLKKLTPGTTVMMDVYTKKKLWPLVVDVIKRETIEVGDKKYDTILVEPKMREEGIFKAKGRIWVWLTDDEKKIPVRMSSKVLIGSVSVDMTEIINIR